MKGIFQYELCLVNVLFKKNIVNFLRISVVSCASVFSVPITEVCALRRLLISSSGSRNYTKACLGCDYVAIVNLSLLSNIK